MIKYRLIQKSTGKVHDLTEEEMQRFFDNRDPFDYRIMDPDMNKLTSLNQLADILDALPEDGNAPGMGFDMEREFASAHRTVKECGSACCIGGWVKYLRPDFRDRYMTNVVAELSGLPWRVADKLCWDDRALSSDTTPQEGAEAIRNALAGSEDPWDFLDGGGPGA